LRIGADKAICGKIYTEHFSMFAQSIHQCAVWSTYIQDELKFNMAEEKTKIKTIK